MPYKKKRDNKPLIIVIALIAAAVAVLVGMPIVQKMQQNRNAQPVETQPETVMETEIPKYTATLYKSSAADLSFERKYLENDSDNSSLLRIPADDMVMLMLSPKKGWNFESVQVMNHEMQDVQAVTTSNTDGTYRINFVMPPSDVIANFTFSEIPETEKPTEMQTEPQTQPESETESEPETEGSPYGLKLHNLTADIISSYNGQFDDTSFLQQLGDALHPADNSSQYYGVSDVYFSPDAYTGKKENDKVYYYIYFNEDPSWKLLSTYYLQEGTYTFTQPPQETEPQTAAQPQTTAPIATASTPAATSVQPAATQPSQPITELITTSLDITSVSTNFLDYVGGQDTFYDKIFDYVCDQGVEGAMTGTMDTYSINQASQTATARFSMSDGSTISVTYDKASGKFKFSGL